MIIYRVETDAGRGPYNGSDLGYGCGSTLHAPTAWEDPELEPVWSSMPGGTKDAFFFGFQSPAQLLEWFHSDRWHTRAEIAGFKVSVIEAAGEVFHGTYQSIFERRKSAVTKRLTFNEIKQLVI